MDRQQFYKSKQWESFRQVIIAERTHEDGFVYCDHCGKPILKKYDLIIHHKEELNELNVNDNLIALNPDNVECVHFKCHNQIHERFGYNTTSVNTYVKKHVYIVYGALCSGRRTWVHDVATPDDLIVDIDNIFQMIGINDRYQQPASLRSVAFDMRDHMYDIIKYRNGKWHNAYVITSGALQGDRERLKKRINADELICIESSKEECFKRVKNRTDITDTVKVQWIEYIIKWYDQYQPDLIPPMSELSEN